MKRFLRKKETHKPHQCRCRTKEGEKCTERFESRKARAAHQVHALWLGGTHGLTLYVTTVTTAHACPMCETAFSNFTTARTHVVQAFRIGRCSVHRSARACEWEEKAETQPPFACPDLECSSVSTDMYIRANLVNIEMPEEMSLFTKLKTLTENNHERCSNVFRRTAGWRRTAGKEEAAQEQGDLTERRARKATTCQRRRGKRRHGGCRNVET